MAKVYECKLVKDRYLYFPQMGMYWDLCPIKRKSGENEAGLNARIDDLYIHMKCPHCGKKIF